MTVTEPIKTCVLGVGLASLTFHIPFILALPHLFSLHSVLERNPTTPGGKVAARFGISSHKVYSSLADILADREIELVVVATPNSTHYDFAKRALEAGKHVLVDKPVTTTAVEARDLGALANAKNLVLYGYQNARWNSDFLALRQLLSLPLSSPHSLGILTEFESHYDRYREVLKGTWKDEPLPGAGQVYDLGTHLIDQALVLFGRPEKATAFIQNVRNIGSPAIDDAFTVLLHYPSRAPHPLTAILRAHILSVRAPQLRYIVRGTQGTYTKYGVDVQEAQLKAAQRPQEAVFEPVFGAEPEELWGRLDSQRSADAVEVGVWPSTEPGSYISLFENLGNAIRNGEELAVKWDEATSVIEIVELAHRSSREGRTVDVPSVM